MQTADDLGKEEGLPAIREDLGASRYDIFGTANFFTSEFIHLPDSVEPITVQKLGFR